MAASTGLKTRVLIAVVAATFLIAVAAIPSFGATKKSVLDVKPNLVVGGSSSDFTVTISNTTPGNSTTGPISSPPENSGAVGSNVMSSRRVWQPTQFAT